MILGYEPDHLRAIMLAACAVVQTLFVLLYFSFPWYKTFLGRALFGKSLVLAVILDSFIVLRYLGLTSMDTVFVGLYTALFLAIFAQLVAFAKVRLEGRADEVSGNSPTHEGRRW